MAKYKFKLSEMSKTASPDEAEKELGTPNIFKFLFIFFDFFFTDLSISKPPLA